jgi:hypothetical protein
MPLLTFNFNVDADGKFTYSPPEASNPAAQPGATNWPYTHRDQLAFRCPKGPFSLKLLRTDIAPGAGGAKTPYGPVYAEKQGADWVAQVPTINDGLDPAVRKSIWQSVGFIAKYRYIIGVADAGKVFVDDTHTGIHTC